MVSLNIELPDGFLEEEERCGYTVTKQMKEVWAVELDLLCELLRVCEKYKIKIFASGGTLLGAVRHKGFIPWDDDIDMMMFREDYTRLCEVAKNEFQYPYFFQTEYTDPGCLRGHAQLRNSETAGLLKCEFEDGCTFNQGIFIDIFPLDNVVEDEEKFKKQGKRAAYYQSVAWKAAALTWRYRLREGHIVKEKIKKILHLAVGSAITRLRLEEKYYRKFEKTCQIYNNEKTPRVSTLSFQFMNRDHIKYRNDFEVIQYLPFEFMKIPVGKGYDHALTIRYGDYMKYKIGSSVHGEVIFDTNDSYKNILGIKEKRV